VQIRKVVSGGSAVAVLAAAAVAVAVTPSVAAPAAPVAGNVTTLASAPRVVASPGSPVNAGQTLSFKIAGESFSGTAIPSDATGVILSVSSSAPAAAGVLRVWTEGAGMPGTPAVSYAKSETATNVAFVGLSDTGRFSVYSSAKTNVLMAITGYITPEAAPAAPVVKTVAAVSAKKIDVGGSIRTRATEFATVDLPAGTWDARVAGTFTGLNNVNNTVPAGVFLTGTMVVQKGDTMGANFENNVTVGGIAIPRSASDTLTQDPTAAINTFITLSEPTTLRFKMFAYASNSSQAGSGELSAAFDGATFVKVS